MNYKDAVPSDTIRRAKEILLDLGLNVTEQLFSHSDVSYSCRISLSDANLADLNSGTNGKGMTREYALASGYAELMERLQNKMLINAGMRYAGLIEGEAPIDFRFYPDEIVQELKWPRFIDLMQDLFPRIIPHGLSADGSKTVSFHCAPYADLTHGGERQVPIAIARIPGSTGMCAGNTGGEAILQGLCEVYERYVLQQLFLSPTAPPRFPEDYFEGTLSGQRLDMLKDEGYRYEICDLSAGGRFPVVGVILTNPDGRKMLRLGSDLDVEIALQRCITETFQGDNAAVEQSFIDYDSPYEATTPYTSELRQEFFRCLHNGTGRHPDKVINGIQEEEFVPWQWRRSGNSTEDLRSEIDRLKRNGLTLLVRDNSFLGFCAYHVIVPGLSELSAALSPSLAKYLSALEWTDGGVGLENNDIIWPLYNPKELIEPANLNDVIEYLEEHASQGSNLRLTPWNTAPSNSINRNLLCFMLCHKCGDDKSAAFYMEKFIREREAAGFHDNSYFRCIADEIRNTAAGRDLTADKSDAAGDELRKQVHDDLTGDVMKNFRFPTCFDCHRCPVIHECRFKELINLERRIQQKQKSATINQTDLNKLFNTEQ